MKTDSAQNDLLTRGGRPTLRDLLDRLEFNPAKGSITLNGERMLLTRASFGSDIRDQLTRRYSEHEAMVLMLRLGFRSGREDAEFIRQSWPTLDPGDAFTAGTRLHMVTGTVKVETLSNDFDFDSDRFSGDFLWHESVEAGAYHKRHGRATRPVCWLQTGYAAGYASVYFRKLVIYKEISCSAMGHKACRVVGKTVDSRGPADPFVQMFLDEVLGTVPGPAQPAAHVQRLRAPEELDALIVEPVRERLLIVARSGAPALITGPAGAGLRSAARWLHRQHSAETALSIVHAQSAELAERLTSLRQTHGPRRAPAPLLAISDIDALPVDRQAMLLDLLTARKGRPPQVAALSNCRPESLFNRPDFLPELAYALNVLPVALPPLGDRRADIPALVQALLLAMPGSDGGKVPVVSDEALALLGRIDLPGNIPQLRMLIHRAALLAETPTTITARDLASAQAVTGPASAPDPAGDPWALLRSRFTDGQLTLDSFNAALLRGALGEAEGNVAAGARLLGLSRPQMAYRLAQADRSPREGAGTSDQQGGASEGPRAG